MRNSVTIGDAKNLPIWKRPIVLLFFMTAAVLIPSSVWFALLNNFPKKVIGINGAEIGWLHGILAIPGFLAAGVIAIIILYARKDPRACSATDAGRCKNCDSQVSKYSGHP